MDKPPRAIVESSVWQGKLNTALATFSLQHATSTLFSKWNRSHDALPQESEDFSANSWYEYFHHSRSILLAAINGSLWPRYLRIKLYPNIDLDLPPPLLDAYYALDEPATAKAWNWEAQNRSWTQHTVKDIAFIQLPQRFVRLYKARRYAEAERAIIECLDDRRFDDSTIELRYLIVIAESMRHRGAHERCKQFLSSHAQLFHRYDRSCVAEEFNRAICRLCVSIFASKGSKELAVVEELLVATILGALQSLFKDMQVPSRYKPVQCIGEKNPASNNSLVLGHIYARCGLDGEAATLLTWGLEFGRTPRSDFRFRCARRLMECHSHLGLITGKTHRIYNEEADKPIKYEPPYYSYSRTRLVAKDSRFKECHKQVRELEREKQGVKRRFNDCLARSNRDDLSSRLIESLERNNQDDFNIVDAVWETMLMSQNEEGEYI